MRYTLTVENTLQGVTLTGLGVQVDLPAGLSFKKAYVDLSNRALTRPIVNATASGTHVTFASMSLGALKKRKVTVVAKAATDAPLNTPLLITAAVYQTATATGAPYCEKHADPVTVRACVRACDAGSFCGLAETYVTT